jgi:membrane protein DedA with SNARE-associated domain
LTSFSEWFQNNSGKLLFVFVSLFAILLAYVLYNVPASGLENKLLYLLKQYGYIILFVWSILEGEIGLVMGGLLCHSGDMNLFLAIFIAGLGAFVGDQIYFYIGRYNKSYINKKFAHHSRKFALATLMLRKYGMGIIFMQRYMYGMRTILPISIGLTRYSAKKFGIINLISAWFWAAFTIVPVWYFGKEIIALFHLVLVHWYYVIPVIVAGSGLAYRAYRRYLNNKTQDITTVIQKEA